MTTINPEKAAQVVALIEDGRSRRYVAEALDLSVSTVQRAYARYLDTNSFQRRSGSGRPRCTTDNDDRFIVLNSLRDRHRTAVQIRNNLRDIRNMNVSVDTVRRRLAEQNLFSRKPAAVPLLTRRHRVARLNFAREHRDWTYADWSKVLFSDESRFCLYSPDGRERIYRRSGERFADCTVSQRHSYNGGGVMIWAGISANAHTDLHFFDRNMNADVYVEEVLIPYVVPYAPFIGENFLFMQDNARPHIARRVLNFLDEVGINRLDWPANSPDLNPIEHLWDNLGRKVRNHAPAPQTLRELQRVLGNEWNTITQDEIKGLIRSMPDRMNEVIRARGGHTHY
jgi:transposase